MIELKNSIWTEPKQINYYIKNLSVSISLHLTLLHPKTTKSCGNDQNT